ALVRRRHAHRVREPERCVQADRAHRAGRERPAASAPLDGEPARPRPVGALLGLTLPRDVIDEIEHELAATRAAIGQDRARGAALEELQAIALVLAATRGRPTTARDLLCAAPSAAERERRRRLLCALR